MICASIHNISYSISNVRRGLLQLPFRVSRDASVSLQDQVCLELRRFIVGGALHPGDPLPSLRALSEQLGVSRNTVIAAYEKLAIEGYVRNTARRGVFVSERLPEACLTVSSPLPAEAKRRPRILGKLPALRQPGVAIGNSGCAIDFRLGCPAAEAFPREFWTEWSAILLRHPGRNVADYPDPGGLAELREALASYLGSSRGIVARPEDIVIVNGIQEAINLMAWLFVDARKPVVTESPCYAGAYNALLGHRARIEQVPVDAQGIDLAGAALPACSLLYVTPSHQYPLGGTLSLERRHFLIEWARRRGAYILEDDYDADFRYIESPLPALAAMDKAETTVYLGTFSKCIGPGLRVGYMVCPPHLSPAVREAKALLNNGSPWLPQAILARMIASGEFVAHLRRILKLYRSRRDRLIEGLAALGGSIAGSDGGMHVAWTLPPGAPDANSIEARLRARDIKVYTLADVAAVGGNSEIGKRTLFLGFASQSETAIDRALGELASSLAA